MKSTSVSSTKRSPTLELGWDPVRARRRPPLVRPLDADEAIDPTATDHVDVVVELTWGPGVEVVLDTIGGDPLARSPLALSPLALADSGRVASIVDAAQFLRSPRVLPDLSPGEGGHGVGGDVRGQGGRGRTGPVVDEHLGRFHLEAVEDRGSDATAEIFGLS